MVNGDESIVTNARAWRWCLCHAIPAKLGHAVGYRPQQRGGNQRLRRQPRALLRRGQLPKFETDQRQPFQLRAQRADGTAAVRRRSAG
ncbi:hypothetical protein M8494_15815 [Serratia ureilytica]